MSASGPNFQFPFHHPRSSTESPRPQIVSEGTIHRLSLYARLLATLQAEGITVVSSGELSNRIHVSAAQIRRDLACFGRFGRQGIGYQVSALRRIINEILGVHVRRKVALVGVGNLGRALLGHRHMLCQDNFEIVAAFDANPKRWEYRQELEKQSDNKVSSLRLRGFHLHFICKSVFEVGCRGMGENACQYWKICLKTGGQSL